MLEGLAPHEPVGRNWLICTGEDNADAHLNQQVDGPACCGPADAGIGHFAVQRVVGFGVVYRLLLINGNFTCGNVDGGT
jgi:hypothetical protein